MSNLKKMMLLLSLGGLLLIVLMIFSVTQGGSDISFHTILDGMKHFDESDKQHLILRDLRMPRVIASALIGCALSLSGAVMQGLTRNPLADTGLLGLNAGAGFALAICYAWLPGLTYGMSIVACFIGAGVGGVLVGGIALSGRKKTSPMRLVLSGIAVTTLLTALSQGIALYFGVEQDMMFWTVGGVTASNWDQVTLMLPLILIGVVVLLVMSPKITLLSLGEDIAKGLGLNTRWVYTICFLFVILLAGIAVSIVGSIAFVGLMTPHMARYFVGADYRRIIPVSGMLGSLLLVLADLLSRTLHPPFEVPIGALIAVVGVPFFLHLARKEKKV